MKIRIEKTLAFWVDAEINGIQIIQDPDASREELTRAVLNEFEENGYARRTLDKKGRIIWQATPAMQDYLKDCELDAADDWH